MCLGLLKRPRHTKSFCMLFFEVLPLTKLASSVYGKISLCFAYLLVECVTNLGFYVPGSTNSYGHMMTDLSLKSGIKLTTPGLHSG